MKTRRKEILGDILRRERVIRRISQETLGNVVGLGKTAISAYELGKASPDSDQQTEPVTRECVVRIMSESLHFTNIKRTLADTGDVLLSVPMT